MLYKNSKYFLKPVLIFIVILKVLPLNCQSLYPVTLEKLRDFVNHDKKSAQTWWYGWIAGYTAATVGQGVVNLTSDDKSLRQDMALGAATTFLGAVGTLFTPVVPGKSTMQKYGFNPDDTARSETYYEAMLREIAQREKAGRSWKVHAIAGAVDLGSGLITWLGFKRTVWDGLINFGLNTVIAEAQIWSQPMRAEKDYNRYLKEKTGEKVPTLKKPEKQMFLSTFPGGITIRVVF